MAIFSVVVFTILSFTTTNIQSLDSGRALLITRGYAVQGSEAARGVRDRKWSQFTVGKHGVATTSGYWDFSGTQDSLSFDGGSAVREVEVEQVYRTSLPNGNISATGTLDTRTRKVTTRVTSTFSGLPTLVVEIVSYLTNWLLTEITHTTDADFASGTFSSIEVNGSGDGASLREVQSVTKQWIAGGFGSSITHTATADFSGGTNASTTILTAGTETFGEVVLATTTPSWGLYGGESLTANYNGFGFVSSTFGFAVAGNGNIAQWDSDDEGWVATSSPTANVLNGISMTTTTGYIAGSGSTILKWTAGGSWVATSSPVSNDFFDVSMTAPTKGYIVGNGGLILKLDGGNWASTSTPTSKSLNGVSMVSSTFGYAVGNNGTIVFTKGGNWATTSSPVNSALQDIHMVSSTFGVAVGNSGVILRYTGGQWLEDTSPVNSTLNGVYMVSSTLGFVVGNSGVLLKWNGTSWTSLSSGTSNAMNDIAVTPGNDEGWAVGDTGTFLRYGKYWLSGTFLSTILDSGSTTSTWNGVSWIQQTPSSTDVTVAFRSGNTATPDGTWTAFSAERSNEDGDTIGVAAGRYLQYRLTLTTGDRGSTPEMEWIAVTYNNTFPYQMNDVAMLATSTGFAVGQSGRIAAYNGTAWATTSSPTGVELFGVSMVSSTYGFAVGDSSGLYKYTGNTWATSTSPVNAAWKSVSLISDSDGFVVGGDDIARWNGTSWSTVTSPVGTAVTLYGVDMVSASDGYAVGSKGSLIRWNGSSWSSLASPVGKNVTLYGVDMLSSSAGFAVGSGGRILQWNGTSWSSVSSPTGSTLRNVQYLTSTLAYAVGDEGKVFVWDGVSWTTDASITTLTLRAISLVNASEGWVTGANGFFGHLTAITGYPSTANFLSTIIDSGSASTTWDSVSWSASTTTSTVITVSTRTGETAVPDGTWDVYSTDLTDSTGSSITSLPGRYLQYRTTFTTTDASLTAQLGDITVSY